MSDRDHRCLGFCGRVPLNQSESEWIFSDCQACPWGTKTSDSSFCMECDEPISDYDFAYLIFHALTPLLINILSIKYYTVKNRQNFPQIWYVLQLCCAFLESSLAFLCAVLFYKPTGSLMVYTCKSRNISEWYPMFYNPVVNYTHTVRCTSEVVYPLFSMPFTILLFSLLNLLLFRTLFYLLAYSKAPVRLPVGPLYAGLWSLPIIAFAHATLSGLIYYAFPYFILVASLTINTVHLAVQGRKSILQIASSMVHNVEHCFTLLLHFILFGFALYSIYLSTQLYVAYSTKEAFGFFAVLLPVPSLYYIGTIRLTEPTKPPRGVPPIIR